MNYNVLFMNVVADIISSLIVCYIVHTCIWKKMHQHLLDAIEKQNKRHEEQKEELKKELRQLKEELHKHQHHDQQE